MAKINYNQMQADLWSRIIRMRLAASETQMLAVIVKNTWGRKRDEVELSMEDFKKATNQFNTISVRRGIEGLVAKGLIIETKEKHYSYVKRYKIQCIPDELAA